MYLLSNAKNPSEIEYFTKSNLNLYLFSSSLFYFEVFYLLLLLTNLIMIKLTITLSILSIICIHGAEIVSSSTLSSSIPSTKAPQFRKGSRAPVIKPVNISTTVDRMTEHTLRDVTGKS